jgi:hypothetical protein
MTKKEVDKIIGFGNSHLMPIEGYPIGVSKFQAFLAIRWLLKGRLYWYALRKAYDGSDNLFHYRHDVQLAFKKR